MKLGRFSKADLILLAVALVLALRQAWGQPTAALVGETIGAFLAYGAVLVGINRLVFKL